MRLQTGSVNAPNFLKPRPAVIFLWTVAAETCLQPQAGGTDAAGLGGVSIAPPPLPGRLSVRLEGLGQVLQQREQLLLLQSGAVGPGQRQVGGHHLAVCAQTQVGS